MVFSAKPRIACIVSGSIDAVATVLIIGARAILVLEVLVEPQPWRRAAQQARERRLAHRELLRRSSAPSSPN
jgi:hypothetical protein